jgi:anti-sigma factor RsiW
MSPREPREREIATYVTGELSSRRRRRLEAHLLECETCWRELRIARGGRRVVESLRELAPALLRDDVRTAVALSAMSRRPSGRSAPLVTVGLILAVVSAAVVMGIASRFPSQPPPIATALSVFRSGDVSGSASAAAPRFPRFDLELRSAGRVALGAIEADAYVYRSGSGSVVLFLSARDFPEAIGARATMTGGWTARDGTSYLSCGSEPVPYLLIGADRELVARIDRAIASGSIGQDG